MQFTLPDYEFPTIASLKAFAAENGIATPTGDKRVRETWENAIEDWAEFQKEAIALAVDAEKTATEATENIEIAVVSIASLVVAALTSETAIGVYRAVLKAAVLAVVMFFMLTQAALKWLWANKHHAAVYHWVSDWLSSKSGKSAVTHVLIAEWVITQWVEAIGDRLDTIAQSWRDAVALVLGRLGLGGVAIGV